MDEETEYRAWQALAEAIQHVNRRRNYEALLALFGTRRDAECQLYYAPPQYPANNTPTFSCQSLAGSALGQLFG